MRPSQQTPCLLILDGHASHTKSLPVLEFPREHGIIMLSLPTHTTHRLQPLDVGFFKPLQTYYDRYIDRWLKRHPGRVFTEYQVGETFKDAYEKAAVVETVTNSFRKCGIWPFNPDAFSDADYAPSLTTDRPLDHTYASDPVSGEASGSSSVQNLQMSTITASPAFDEAGVQSAAELPPIPAATSGARSVSDEAGVSSDPVFSAAGGLSSMQMSNNTSSPASGEASVQSAAELSSILVATSGVTSASVSDAAGGLSDPVSSAAGDSSSVQVLNIQQSHSQPVCVSPFDIASPPSVEGYVAKRRRRATTSTVLTWSPYMNEVKLRAEKKQKASSVSKTLFKEMEKCGDNGRGRSAW